MGLLTTKKPKTKQKQQQKKNQPEANCFVPSHQLLSGEYTHCQLLTWAEPGKPGNVKAAPDTDTDRRGSPVSCCRQGQSPQPPAPFSRVQQTPCSWLRTVPPATHAPPANNSTNAVPAQRVLNQPLFLSQYSRAEVKTILWQCQPTQ